MKQLLVIISFLLVSVVSNSQNMVDFFENHGGMRYVGRCAHLTNDYSYGNYNVGTDYATIEVHYKDVNLNGNPIITTVALGIGSGILPFNSIQATSDNDYVDPFDALELGCWFIQRLIQNSNPEQYNKIRQAMIVLLGTDPNNWNGRDWALFAMNLAYINYHNSVN